MDIKNLPLRRPKLAIFLFLQFSTWIIELWRNLQIKYKEIKMFAKKSVSEL